MNILNTPVDILQASRKLGGLSQTQNNDQDKGMGFADILKNSINEINSLQLQSEELKNNLVTGDLNDLHQVTIAAEKSSLAFQLTLQIRNKVVEAYQEIMRMQV
ncbi:flagellar hook-basal body complex protein FliE [Phosphitispora sp. TUW77]|uniref:flagellar hook-basal body complex protein FliE n=1 Tax=Phosphitispora sp. TUW77 TaxID=3152361 RepID=UPI003AB303C8